MKNILYAIIKKKTVNPIVILLQVVLYLFSLLYSLIVRMVCFFYKKNIFHVCQLEKPVISVGNITVGGVGKTPLVILIAKYVKELGKLPVVLTRGYMDKPGESDEAIMLKKELPNIPVLVGVDRFNNAKIFLESNPADVFIMDDGYQHWKLHRDLNIVALDTTAPWGNGFVLPRGTLRESKSSLSRADMFVLTRVNQAQEKKENILNELSNYSKNNLIVETIHKPMFFIDCKTGNEVFSQDVNKQGVCSFSSIGNPESFLLTLGELNIHPVKHFMFVDHHSFSQKDIEEIAVYCKNNQIKSLVTTNKDAVKIVSKIENFQDINVYALKIEIEITKGKEVFFERIFSVL